MSIDDPAISGVYRAHRAAVFWAACRICGSAMAEDVTQEVFEHLWRHPDRFDPARGTLEALLVTSSRHRALDMARSEGSRRLREMSFGSKDPSRRGNVYSDVSDSDVLERDEAARIAEAVSRLPQREQDALVEVFYGEQTYRAAAAALGQPEGTTKARIRSGLRRLSTELGEFPVEVALAEPLR